MVTWWIEAFLRSAILQRVNGEVIQHIKKTDRLLNQAHKTTKFYKFQPKTTHGGTEFLGHSRGTFKAI